MRGVKSTQTRVDEYSKLTPGGGLCSPVPLLEDSSGHFPVTGKLHCRSTISIACASSGLCWQARLIAITKRQMFSKSEKLKRSKVRWYKQERQQLWMTGDSHVTYCNVQKYSLYSDKERREARWDKVRQELSDFLISSKKFCSLQENCRNRHTKRNSWYWSPRTPISKKPCIQIVSHSI